MPDFDAHFASGVTLDAWVDPPKTESPTTGAGGAPARINPIAGHPPSYFRATPGATVTVEAIVGDTSAPLDSALDGRLFTTHFAELPIWPPPLITSPAGQSSRATFTPYAIGHHLVVLRRDGGGAIALHFEVKPDAIAG
jgi:hypothetical protein